MESGLRAKKENMHKGKNLNAKSVHKDIKPETKARKLVCNSKESKNLFQNNFEDNLEEIFQASCKYCGWSGASNHLVLSFHTKHFHQEDIDLDNAFEAEVKAGLVEPLDC